MRCEWFRLRSHVLQHAVPVSKIATARFNGLVISWLKPNAKDVKTP